MKRYSPGCPGFVLEHLYPAPVHHEKCLAAGHEAEGCRCRCHRDPAWDGFVRSYWYGPRQPLPILAWGPLDYSVAVFPSRPAVRRAVEAYGYAWRSGWRARRVADVEREIAERESVS